MAEKPQQNPTETTSKPATGGIVPIVGILIAVAVIIIVAIVFNSKQGLSSATASTSKYVVLFRNIELAESAAIIESLKSQGIKDYKIEDGGATILVPRKYKDTAAIKIAGDGIMPNGGSVGYEIFDKGGQLGATDFDKQVKLSRAISGELSRNIRRIYGIEDARVQVVIPQTELFAETKNPVQAAVFLKVASDVLLTPAQVSGIVSLVASSVENLKKENVTVVDYNGRVLSSEEYTTEYDRLFAMLQRKKLEMTKGATKDLQKLLLGDTKTAGLSGGDDKDGYDVASMYKKLRAEKKSKGLQFKTTFAGKRVSGSEATLQQKMQFKKEYETLLERNVRAIAYQFFPKNAVSAKVNVELNNLDTIGTDPVSMVARITTVLLLDENNKNVKLNPEIREALFKSLSSAVGYINGRDRIDLRWAPMLNFNDKGSAAEKGRVSFEVSNALGILKGLRLPSINFTFVLYLVGFIALVKIVSMLRRRPKVVVPETDTTQSSIFEQKKEETSGNFSELKEPSIEQVKKAVEKAPEKIAGIIEQWFQEDQNN
jgi:flagellar biosynthesis/type III secretory pathway M-ring protein FliF/YscJ